MECETRMVLVFGKNKKLACVFPTLTIAGSMLNASKQGIYSVCKGKTISFKGYYFRYLFDTVEVTFDDLGVLTIDEYDELCDVSRPIHKTRNIKKKKNIVLTNSINTIK